MLSGMNASEKSDDFKILTPQTLPEDFISVTWFDIRSHHIQEKTTISS